MLRKDDRTYVIDRDGAIERINADRVTYAPPLEDSTESHEEATGRHEKNTEGPTSLMDQTLNYRNDTHRLLELQVKWYGYNGKTWYYRYNIPEELVSRYFTKQARTTRALTVIVDG